MLFMRRSYTAALRNNNQKLNKKLDRVYSVISLINGELYKQRAINDYNDNPGEFLRELHKCQQYAVEMQQNIWTQKSMPR